MKGVSLMACIAIFCSVSCQKVLPDLPAKSLVSSIPVSSNYGSFEDLGTAIKGSTVLWKINPMFENIEPLITYAPNSNGGYVAVIIDNGNLSTSPLKFIAVNLQTNVSTTVRVKDRNGMQVTGSLGRVSRYMFGMNKKYYVATENGGHLIEYDPNTLTATDLGQPFNIDGHVLDIYSLSVGKDGALYGGSFGSSGDVYTFRYDYNNNFYVDKTSLDNEAKYVTYVSGDDKFNYASCGQNSWKLIAIERATGKKQVLVQSANASDRIYLTGNADACYSQSVLGYFKLNGFTANSVASGNKAGAQVQYLPYEPSNTSLPKIVWSECDKKLYYKFPGATENSVTINDITDEVYAVGAMAGVGDKLFISGGKVPRFVTYSKQSGFTCLGTPSLNVYLMAVVPGSNGTKVVMGGYPKGAMLEYNTNAPWTMGSETISYTPPEITSTQSNPRRFVQLQDADAAGVYGPMTLNGILYTKDGTMVAAGNNDRLTGSGTRELGIGTYKNGVKRNFTNAEFPNYEFQSMCLSYDSTQVYISAISKFTNEGRIFVYSPATNSITASIPFSGSINPGNIQLYAKNVIVGSYDDVLYLFDINAKKVVFTKTLGSGQRIHAFTIAPDHSVWIDHAYMNVFLTKLVKFNFDITNINAVTSTVSDVTIIKSPDADESTQPGNLLFFKAPGSSSYDLYISGFKSLCRLNNACTTIN